MEPTAQEVNDVLERAHDLILRNGWCQEWLETSDGRHCTLGAIAAVVGARDCADAVTYPDIVPLCYAATEAVREALPNPQPADGPMPLSVRNLRTVTGWNDTEGRTVDDVLDLYRLAQKKLAEQ